MRHLTPNETAGLVMLKELSEVPANRHVAAAAEWIDDAVEHEERTIGYYPAPEQGCVTCPFGGQRVACGLHELISSSSAVVWTEVNAAPEQCPWRQGWTVVMHAANRGGVAT